MSYKIRISPHAKRDMKKIPSKEAQISVAKTIVALEQNPRPFGYEQIKSAKKRAPLYRVYSEDRRYRILYSIEEDRTVVILAVRRRQEDTYRNLPTG